MQYDGLAWATALLALLVAVVAGRVLFNRSWFLGWLRGTCGLAFLALALLVALVARDLWSYSELPQDKPLVTLNFKALGPQNYQVTLLEGGSEREVLLDGDLWQLDARLFKWKGLGELLGLAPGYRLERISGRYLAIEQQALAQHPRAQLASSPYGVDLWRWLRLAQRDFFLFAPEAQRVTYLPMADGAVYSVNLSPTGLMAQPLNPVAEESLKGWR
ncbi:hypothetical protein ACFW0H_28185 [Pseudomonas sp. CR3202]|uniref:hypothetical protein n=1 Tax=Pseudomonas sp. CR3202 TaxID=3351532 RepID=UPI003BEF944C